MMIALCGTPGTGKTTLSQKLAGKGYRVVDLKELIIEKGIQTESENDEAKDIIVDLDHLEEMLKILELPEYGHLVLDGHLSYLAPFDLCIVLRLNPNEIESRLAKRGYSEEKIRENMEAEAVGSVLIEALQKDGTDLQPPTDNIKISEKVFEFDTTGKDPDEVFNGVNDIISLFVGKRLYELSRYRPGTVDWLEVAAEWY